MAQYKYPEDFNLGGLFLSDMGGMIYNTDDTKRNINQVPDMEHSTDKDGTNDGERYIQSRYSTRSFENIPIIWKAGTDLARIRAWLGKKVPQTFYWRNDEEHKEIDVILSKSFDFGGFYGRQIEFDGQIETLSFIAHNPYWRIRGEYERKITTPVIGQEYLVKSNGNVESSPIIRIKVNTPQTNVQIKWNDLIINLSSISTNQVYIDSDLGEVYDSNKNNLITTFTTDSNYTMPILLPFEMNKIKVISGNIAEIGIKLNSLII
jgi:hypothetical protein